MFYSCAGCQKLLQTCEDDVASCLPLTGAKRRTSDGKMRRCGLITGARAIVLVLLLTMLLALLISVGHPPTLVRSYVVRLGDAPSLYRGRTFQQRGITERRLVWLCRLSSNEACNMWVQYSKGSMGSPEI